MVEWAMASYNARIWPCGPRLLRFIVTVMMVASSPFPAVTLAASTRGQSQPDLEAFDQGFQKGQDEFNRQQYLAAARVWTGAAEQLPEDKENKENRRGIYEYIAEAYEKELDRGIDDATLREGLAVLDAYAEAFTAAHPSDALSEHVARTRLKFRTQIAEIEEERLGREKVQEQPAPAPAPAPIAPGRVSSKPWRGLAIGGGVAIAGSIATLGMFAAGLAGAKSAEAKVEDPARGCDLDELVGECADLDRQGRTSNAIGVTGLIATPLLLSAGITMLVIAMRRKKSNKTIAPMFSPSMAGVVWEQRF